VQVSCRSEQTCRTSCFSIGRYAPPWRAPIWTALTIKTGGKCPNYRDFFSDWKFWPRTHPNLTPLDRKREIIKTSPRPRVQPVSADMRFRNLESGMQGKDFDNLSYLFCFAVLKTDLQNFRFRIPESRFLIPESHVCGNGL